MTAIGIKQLTGKHVFAICLGFFGVMLAVNMLFLFLALSTFNGGQGGKAYQTGLEYNRTIEAARVQEALGWSHRLETPGAGRIVVTLSEGSGAPVAGLALSGEIGRPVADKFTRPLAFSEMRPGIYAAEAGELDPGNWVVSLAARPAAANDTVIYRAKERLWLKPNS
jgi:nitrogen fixation protein FixH